MNIYLKILINQLIIFATSILALYYFNHIPSFHTLKQQTVKISVWYLILGTFLWLILYLIIPGLAFVLATAWFFAIFITTFLLLYNYYSLRTTSVFCLLLAFTLTLSNYFLNSYYINNVYMITGLIGVAALIIKYIPLSYHIIALISIVWLINDIISVWIIPDISFALLKGAETTAFKNTFTFIELQVGSADIFIILFYTLFVYKILGIKRALLISILLILPLLALPVLFHNQIVPYLVIIVPLFLIIYPLYKRI